jgi:subtilisin family serine protease
MSMKPRARPSVPLRRHLAALAGLMLFSLAALAPAAGASPTEDDQSARRIVVAIDEKPDPMLANASSPRGYAGLPDYSGSHRTRRTAQRLAGDFALTEITAWMIEPLRVRCMVYEIPASSDRAQVLDALSRDPRVALAQPLQTFTTLTVNPPSTTTTVEAQARFNDPYVGLQTGFRSIAAGHAQRWSSGANVSVALIDTGVDARHPDLAGRVAEQRDFVGSGEPGRDRHGTEVAGIIAAVANNRVGIVGIAPSVELHSYRACWPLEDDASRAHCNSFTLAQALAEAIRTKARIINLSLGGPHDPLLEKLLERAIAQGAIVIGAVAADASAQGFPIRTRGVIAVDSSGAATSQPQATTLYAPGIEILTLEPGGSYDYASGSSLATAHVTGAVALLLQVAPRLDETSLVQMLRDSAHRQGGPIDVCVAIRAATGQPHDCGEDARAAGVTHALR